MRRFAALTLASLLALAACSDDGGSGASATTNDDAGATMPTNAPGVTDPTPPADGEPEGVQSFDGLEQTHVDTPVNYPQTPPVGGPHNPVWQTCAFYDTPIYNETGVHSMEHGAVWVTFQPDLPADQVALLKKDQTLADEVLVSPYPNLPAPVVASAWGKQLQLQSADDPRLVQFITYFSNGPQTPEKNTPCEGGTDQPAP